MSIVLPVLYHWSPEHCRAGIVRRGLTPRCETAVERFGSRGLGERKVLPHEGFETVKAVCLGTSPSHAWSLCGALWGQRGETWDLWQIALDDGDECIAMPWEGFRLGEIRVANRIPKSRVWHVGSRTIGPQRWSAA